MINGAPTDSNAARVQGRRAQRARRSDYRIAKEYDTPDWSPDRAQTEMDQAISALGRDGFVGVYAANDGTAGGAIASMRSNGIDPATRPTTGQDAELAGIQRIVVGDQYMTVFKAYTPEATQAAQLAVALLNGDTSSDLVNRQIDNGMKEVPSVILTPVAVTQDNIRDTVVRDGLYTVDQICTSAYAAACRRIGLTQGVSARHDRDARDGAAARAARRQQALRRRAGARRRRLRRPRRRGRRPRRRQRRRQVDAREGDVGHLPRRRGRVPLRGRACAACAARTTRPRSASRPSTRTSRCATTSTSSRTCSSAARRSPAVPAACCARSTRPRWSSRRPSCCRR